MAGIDIIVNNERHQLDVPADMPLLWALRDELGLIGTKFGCGIGLCGACTVHVDGVAMRACAVRMADVAGKTVRTIEGLAEGTQLHPLQRTWIEQDVAQCGYCQSGQIMAAAALLERNAQPDLAEIDAAMAGNYCRCGTYNRVRSAIQGAAQLMSAGYVDAAAEVKA